MGVRHPKREEINRLDAKTLDAQFTTVICDGLNCSAFEAQAVLQVVKEVYAPAFADATAGGLPGRITLVALDADEPGGKPVTQCHKRTVQLTVHRGSQDDLCMQQKGPGGFRISRIADLCQEALSQGSLLTREDLAYRIFFVHPRTISRDLKQLRDANPDKPIPLRGTVHDIGPVLTHRIQIVQLALAGLTTSQICQRMHHSPAAVGNYLSTFTRCAQLEHQGLQASQIAFLLHRGTTLVQRYLELLKESRLDPNKAYHLQQFLELGCAAKKKKPEGKP